MPFLSSMMAPFGNDFFLGADSSWSERAFGEDGCCVSSSCNGRKSDILEEIRVNGISS